MRATARPFVLAHAAGGNAGEILRECLKQLGPPSERHTLGFIYATAAVGDSMPGLTEVLRRHFPGVTWVGGMAAGILATGREYYDEPALALMLTDIPRGDFHLFDAVNSPEELVPHDQCKGGCFALVHGDPDNPETPAIIEALAERAPNLFVNGGITATPTENYQVLDGIVSGGLSGVVVGGGTLVFTDHTQGCTPLGMTHTITEAEENVLVALDGRPAYDVMKQEIGEVLARDLKKVDGYIFAGFPVNGAGGDYLVRNLLGIEVKRGYVAVGENLERHRKMVFCRRDGNSAREDLAEMLARIKHRVGARTIRGGIYVSCVGRGRYQFGDGAAEIGLIREWLGEFPLAGFFANGEIYNGRLYGYTGVLTLFV